MVGQDAIELYFDVALPCTGKAFHDREPAARAVEHRGKRFLHKGNEAHYFAPFASAIFALRVAASQPLKARLPTTS